MRKKQDRKQDRRRPAPFTFRAAALGGLAHAVLMALAFPPLGVWPLAIAAPVPLIWVASRAKSRPVIAALSVCVGVLPFWVFVHRWVLDVSELGFPGLVLLQSLYAGLFVFLLGTVRRASLRVPMSVAAPVLWVGVEVLRGEVVLTGYPWFLAAHPLIDSPTLSSPGAVIGAYGVSFLVVALCGALADAAGWGGVRRSIGGIGAGVVAGCWGVLGVVGAGSTPSDSGQAVQVTLVQTSLAQSNKIALSVAERQRESDRLGVLVRENTPRPPGLLVVPETMFMGLTLSPDATEVMRGLDLRLALDDTGRTIAATSFADAMTTLQRESGVPMLVGAIGYDGYELDVLEDGHVRPRPGLRRFNSVFLVADGFVQDERYDKIELTPFGEMIPYLEVWPSLRDWVLRVGAEGMAFDLSSGTRPVRLAPVVAPGVTLAVATPICFEATKSSLCRRLAYADGRPAVAAIVNVSNDGWFGNAAGGRTQHLQCARWRCVELGLPMLRAVNTGISAHIDRRGRVVASTPVSEGADGLTLSVSVASGVAKTGTVFGRIGNVFAWAVLAMAVLLPAGVRLLAPLLRSSRTRATRKA